MIASNHVLAGPATTVPAYCTSGTGVRTPAQWQTCWNLGWHLPTTAAAHAGSMAGGALPLILVVVAVLVLFARPAGRRVAARVR